MSNFNPLAQYNDRLMCMQALNPNKGESPTFYNIDSMTEVKYINPLNPIANNGFMQPTTSGLVNIDFDIYLYPNPANREVNIYGMDNGGTIEIMDALGKVILSKKIESGQAINKLELPHVANGVYAYRITVGNKPYFGKLNIIGNE
jgi:hypothetical protein